MHSSAHNTAPVTLVAAPIRNAQAENSRLLKNAAGGSWHAVSPALVFPPGPPFPRRPLSKGIPPGEKTHPGGHSTAFFVFYVGRLCSLHSSSKTRNTQTAAGETEPRRRSIINPLGFRPQSWGQPVGRSANGTLAGHTSADTPRNDFYFSCLRPFRPTGRKTAFENRTQTTISKR